MDIAARQLGDSDQPIDACRRHVNPDPCGRNEVYENRQYAGGRLGIGGGAHQNATIRFGAEPTTSALDVDCKLHDLDNVYVADSSFFVSATAVNPTLANALRVADTITQRLGRTKVQAQPANKGLPVITEMAGDRAGTSSR